ncbi:MAG: transglutaminase family protein [Lachnospiraceae bacterium]|nr:transglutaminase family protein [Lachnospiraceae bacterium]
MKRLGFTYRTGYQFDIPVYEHYYTLKIYPRENERQQILSFAETVSYSDSHSYSFDAFGNKTVYGNIHAPHSEFGFEIQGVMLVDGTKPDTDDRLLSVLASPSSMTGKTPLLAELLERACNEAEERSCYQRAFRDMKVLEQVVYLSDYCHELLCYTPNVTNVSTDATEAARLGKGVCQDYSHILIAFLRMLHIPARYVVGFMAGEGYTHAWVEAFCEGCWYGVDPTNSKLVDDTYIKLSHGRDYNDTIVCKGHFYGNAKQSQAIQVSVYPC